LVCPFGRPSTKPARRVGERVSDFGFDQQGPKNVFLKYYSQSVTELVHWSESDAKYYQEAIGQTLKDYLPDQGEKSE
ncbi:hypothetical protein ODR99_25040, partial [Escherichia coli]|nr:hypothetical protein [Escherichia coli]